MGWAVNKLKIWVAGLVPVLAATCVNAGAILQPVDVSTDIPDYATGFFTTDHLINQDTLDILYISGLTDFDDYIAQEPTDGNFVESFWGSLEGIRQGSLVFDLGGTAEIESLLLWNRGTENQGIMDFSLSASLNLNFTEAIELGSFVAAEKSRFDGNSRADAQRFNFDPVVARYVELDISSVYGSCCISFSEVAFNGAMQIPAPGTLGLTLLGLGLTSAFFRRRKGRC